MSPSTPQGFGVSPKELTPLSPRHLGSPLSQRDLGSLSPSGIWGLPHGPAGHLTEPVLAALCVLLKCSAIKPFYPENSPVALVSSPGPGPILLPALVFDLRFKSARPPCFRERLGQGSRAPGAAPKPLGAAGTRGTAELSPSPNLPFCLPFIYPSFLPQPFPPFSHPCFAFPAFPPFSLSPFPCGFANCQQMTSPFMFGAERGSECSFDSVKIIAGSLSDAD